MLLDKELLEPKGIPVHGIVVEEDVDPLGVLELLEAPLLLLKLAVGVAVPEIVAGQTVEPEVGDLADLGGVKLHRVRDVDDIELFQNLPECLPSLFRLPAGASCFLGSWFSSL